MDFEDEDQPEYSSAQEYAMVFPQERFMVTYVAEVGGVLDDAPTGYQRVNHLTDDVASAGAMVSMLQSQGIDTVEVFKLEPYPIARTLAVYEKKKRRVKRRAAKKGHSNDGNRTEAEGAE